MDALMCGAYCCAGISAGLTRAHALVDASRNQLCEKCRRRLCDVKHHRAHESGRVCHPQCKSKKRAPSAAPLTAAVAPHSHKRARSDPGEPQMPVRATAHRVQPERPETRYKKQKTTEANEITRLLDETN